MTQARKSDLILVGREVKLRLQAERVHTKSIVHVDWVRFTARLNSAPLPDAEDLFPSVKSHQNTALSRMLRQLREMADPDFAVSVQAKALAQQACEALGPDFSVYPEVRKGHDFYRFRWSIVRNDVECGWVGYLSSGDSPRQKSQSSTIHCNLYGTACTFAKPGFNKRLAELIRETKSTITRVDLALDLFDGIRGGMERVTQDYTSGLMDNRGRRPSCRVVGDWCNGRSRSFYTGSKEAGKESNVYEKGHQLFGRKDDSPWVRCEVRYGNKLRFLDADVLDNPDHYFAGASDWHAALVRQAGEDAKPVSIKTTARLKTESILAEVKRNTRWLLDTAAPSIALAFRYLGTDSFMELVENQKLPGRLQKFAQNEVASAYERAFKTIKGSGFGRLGFDPYQQAATT